MLYPVNIEQKLGFDKVRELVAQECISAMGVAFVHKMRFSTDFELINRLLGQAEGVSCRLPNLFLPPTISM